MREKNLCGSVVRSASESCRRIATLRRIEMVRAVVRHSSNDQWRAPVPDHDVLVQEHLQPDPSELLDPSPGA